MIQLVGRALHSSRASGLRKFLAKKNLILSDRLQKIGYNLEEGVKKVYVGFSTIDLPQRVLTVGVSPCLHGFTTDLYGFTTDRAREEASLVHILYLHKKIRLLISHCTGLKTV